MDQFTFRTIKRNAKRAVAAQRTRAICLLLLSLGVYAAFALLEEIFIFVTGSQRYWSILLQPKQGFSQLLELTWLPLAITAGILLFSLILHAPLGLGIRRWYFLLSGGQEEEVGGAFYFFSRLRLFGRSVWFTLSLLLRRWFWGILFLLPGSAVGGFSIWCILHAGDKLDIMWGSYGLVAAAVLLLGGGLLYFVYTRKYFLAPFLLAQNSELSTHRAISLSCLKTRSHCVRLAVFELSFLGWRLLNVLILPMLYTVPYLQTAYAIQARILLEFYERRGEAGTEVEGAPAEPSEAPSGQL